MHNKEFENLKNKISEYIELFKNKIKKINLENNNKFIINNIEILENETNIKKKLIDLSEITKDDKNNIIIKPFKKENIKEIINKLNKMKKDINLTTFKDHIKINKEIITIEKKNNLIKTINKEKEFLKILIRNLRKKENEKCKKDLKEKKLVQKIIDESIKKIENIVLEKIKNIK
ncbi:ribosome-recycling factor [Candidatus Nasuia deltocephalinicola]|uniref:ribosome-recycling factor n=1 Tax=Candidatus Nasuia deltocephalincola TaxID=1160784 RepID=UPI00216AE618|nr:ribosome-recycling factor [Candidatus Nasuia deltocephalinicola]